MALFSRTFVATAVLAALSLPALAQSTATNEAASAPTQTQTQTQTQVQVQKQSPQSLQTGFVAGKQAKCRLHHASPSCVFRFKATWAKRC